MGRGETSLNYSQLSQYFTRLTYIRFGHKKVYKVNATLLKFLLGILFWISSLLAFFGWNLISVEPSAVNFLQRPYPVSIEKIKKLGYAPRVNLDEGLGLTKVPSSKLK
jgi:hypothetical protein